jgi:hypothetical protein
MGVAQVAVPSSTTPTSCFPRFSGARLASSVCEISIWNTPPRMNGPFKHPVFVINTQLAEIKAAVCTHVCGGPPPLLPVLAVIPCPPSIWTTAHMFAVYTSIWEELWQNGFLTTSPPKQNKHASAARRPGTPFRDGINHVIGTL